jgi:hypothetical protein
LCMPLPHEGSLPFSPEPRGMILRLGYIVYIITLYSLTHFSLRYHLSFTSNLSFPNLLKDDPP